MLVLEMKPGGWYTDHYTVLIDIELMARTGGLRVLLHSMAEGPLEMAPLIASAFLYIVDSPRTRVFLHAGTDLEVMPTSACSITAFADVSCRSFFPG